MVVLLTLCHALGLGRKWSAQALPLRVYLVLLRLVVWIKADADLSEAPGPGPAHCCPPQHTDTQRAFPNHSRLCLWGKNVSKGRPGLPST